MRSMAVLLVLIVAWPVRTGALEDPVARRAARRLVRLQNPDGEFRLAPAGSEFTLREQYDMGSQALAGLALLSACGVTRAVERSAAWLMRQQHVSGSWSKVKPLLEDGYIVQFLTELLLAARAGAPLRLVKIADLERAAALGARALVAAQAPSGGWKYGEWDYEESATAVAVLDALHLARAAGFAVFPETFRRALDYLATRACDSGGFMNGQREHVSSPHMTAAVLAVLAPLRREPRVAAWMEAGRKFVQEQRDAGYLREAIFEPGTKEADDLLELKHTLGARRHLYGCFYLSLGARRNAPAAPPAETYVAVRAYLLSQRTARGSWTSTVGEAPSTALALLALTVPQGRLALHRLAEEKR